jgi:hypothetical protein
VFGCDDGAVQFTSFKDHGVAVLPSVDVRLDQSHPKILALPGSEAE